MDPENKEVTVLDHKSGITFHKPYDELLISTGASPITPDFMKSPPKNVFILREISDGEAIKEALEKNSVRDVVVVGGGYIGLEMVEAFYDQGKNVTLINRSGKIMKTYDGEIREVLMNELEEKGIHLYLDDEVEEMIPDDEGMIKQVKTNRDEYNADLVVVAIGIRPSTEFVKDIGLEMLDNGAIITDRQMKTSLDNIYAAGDCASVYHRMLKKPVYIPLATHANKQGRILAEILAGKDKFYPGALGTSVVRVMDITLSQTGLSLKECKDAGLNFQSVFIKTPNKAGYYPDNNPVYIKYLFDKDSKVLLGAQMAGKEGVAHRINSLAVAIDQGMTLEEIALSDFAYAPPFSGTWDATQVAANVGN